MGRLEYRGEAWVRKKRATDVVWARISLKRAGARKAFGRILDGGEVGGNCSRGSLLFKRRRTQSVVAAACVAKADKGINEKRSSEVTELFFQSLTAGVLNNEVDI